MEPTNDLTAPELTGAASTTPTASTSRTTSRSAKKAGTTDSYSTTHQEAGQGDSAGMVNDVLNKGKQWLDESGLMDKAGQLPQQAKDLGQQAWSRVSGLSNTQKWVGLGLLTAGVAFLATRGKGRKHEASEYRDRPRRSPFDKHNELSGSKYDQRNERGWGGSGRYGSSAASGKSDRISSGSGYGSTGSGSSSFNDDFGSRGTASSSYGSSESRRTSYGSPAGSSQRRDQGPGRYNPSQGGRQNPNVDDQDESF